MSEPLPLYPIAHIHEVTPAPGPFALSAEDKAAFERDGAIIFRNALSNEAIAAVERDLLTRIVLLERHFSITPPTMAEDREGIDARLLHLYDALPASQGALYDAMALAPSLVRIAGDVRLHAYISALLSPAVSVHPRHILLMSPPQNEWHLAVWHQDWFYNAGPHSTLTLYAPLQRTTSFNGGLKLALGEWQNGFLPHGEHNHGVKTKWHSIAPEAAAKFRRIAEPELEPGDLLLFNSLVPHNAQINRSGQVRMVINLRFQDLTDHAFTGNLWRVGELTQARQALARKEGN